MKCPCCETDISRQTLLTKPQVPALNNRVYKSADDAIRAKAGTVELQLCPHCQYTFNAAFDLSLVDYENGYDAGRSSSQIYVNHRHEVADWCAESLDNTSIVLEIGCGDGSFLEALCSKASIKGVGFDPGASASRKEEHFEIRREAFEGIREGEKPYDMVVLRHVMEHISSPKTFLANLLAGGTLAPGGSLIIEVPDMDWVLANDSVFDITYEHCGYFTEEALQALFHAIGFEKVRCKRPFGGQYLLVEGKMSENLQPTSTAPHRDRTDSITQLNQTLESVSEKLSQYQSIAIWGAAGKGVIFISDLNADALAKIKFLIDIKAEKNKCYTPVTAKIIMPPNHLEHFNELDLIVIMNPMYESEIRCEIEKLNIAANIVTAQDLVSNSHLNTRIDA